MRFHGLAGSVLAGGDFEGGVPRPDRLLTPLIPERASRASTVPEWDVLPGRRRDRLGDIAFKFFEGGVQVDL